MDRSAPDARSCWRLCPAVNVVFALWMAIGAMAVPSNPYPEGFQQTPVFGVDETHYNDGQDFTLLQFPQTGALVFKIIFNYGLGGTLGSIKLIFDDATSQTTPFASEQDPDYGDIFKPVEYAFDAGETVTNITVTRNAEANAHTLRTAPGRIEIYTSNSGPGTPAVKWEQNIYNCGIFGLICGNNGFGELLEDTSEVTTILGSGLFVGMLGNSVHGPRAISFLFLHPIVSSSLTDISYPDLDKALPAMPRVADGIVPLIQNALLAPAPAITQSYTESTVDSYTYTQTTAKARELGYTIGFEIGGAFDISVVKASTKLTLGQSGKWTVTTTESEAVFQSLTVTNTKTLNIPALAQGSCIRYLLTQIVGVLDQSYSGKYHLVVKSPELANPGVFDFPSFGVLNVQQTQELRSTSRPCTPEEAMPVPGAANPTANATGLHVTVVDKNVSPLPEPLPGGNQSSTLPVVTISPEPYTCYLPITFQTEHTIAAVAKELAVATYEVTAANSGIYDCPQDVVPSNASVVAPLCAPCFGLKCDNLVTSPLDFNVTETESVIRGEAQLYEKCLLKKRG